LPPEPPPELPPDPPPLDPDAELAEQDGVEEG
jgi:hypothetical protein